MKIAFITGVSSGIGYAATISLLKKGYKVIGSVRKQSDFERLKMELSDTFIPLMFDVQNIEEVETKIKEISPIIANNGLDLLINNAGQAIPGPLQHLSEDEFQKQLDINVSSVRRITNLLLPYLGTDRKYSAGKIINISSISGLFVAPFNSAYSVSKFALEALTDGYRRELDIFGIKVVAIQPGPIKTKIWSKNMGKLKRFESTPYGEVLKNADKMIENAEKDALDVEQVNRVIDKILNSKKPKARYLIHKSPLVFKFFAKVLSDHWQDVLVSRGMRKGERHRTI